MTTTAPRETLAAAIPHRKDIRAWMAPIATRSTARALALTVFDILFFAAALAATLFCEEVAP